MSDPEPETGQLLVDKGADIYLQDNTGMNPLSTAVYYKREALISTLLNLGADPTTKDFRQNTLLHHFF